MCMSRPGFCCFRSRKKQRYLKIMKDWKEGPSPQYIGKESVPPGIAHCQPPRQTRKKAVMGVCSSKEGVASGITETFSKRNAEGQQGISDALKSGVSNVAEGVKEGVSEGMAKNLQAGVAEGIANNLKTGVTESLKTGLTQGVTEQVKDGITSNLQSGAENIGASIKDKVVESATQAAADGLETIKI